MKTRMLLSTAAIALLTIGTAMAQSDSDRRKPDDGSRPQTQDSQRDQGAKPQARPKGGEQRNQQGAQAPQGSQPGQAQTGAGQPDAKQRSSEPRRDRTPANAQGAPASAQDAQKQPDQKTQRSQSSGDKSQQGTQSTSTTPSSQGTQSTKPSTTPSSQGTQSTQQSTTPQAAPSPQQSAAPAQQGSTGQAASVQLNDQQRTQISATISQQNVRPLTSVNFSISVGTVVPRTVRVQTLPSTIVSIVPQYRGYSYFVVEDRIVIVEPRTKKIVTTIEYSGGRAGSRAASSKKLQLTAEQRAAIRRGTTSQPRATTGAGSSRTRISVGERVPEGIELQSFPATVYEEVPVVREYRYFTRDRDVIVVDPGEQRIIEIIR